MLYILEHETRKAWDRNAHGESPEGLLSLDEFLREYTDVEVLSSRKTHWTKDCAWHVFGGYDWFKKMKDHQIYESLFTKKYFFFLKSRGFKQLPLPKENTVVIYSNNNEPAHYGLFDGLRVVSKIGSLSLVRHEIETVPLFYGNEVSFFKEY